MVQKIPPSWRRKVRQMLNVLGLGPRRHLVDVLPGGSVGAEIGVWRGDFSRVLLDRVEPRRLHLVDRWAPGSGGTSGAQGRRVATADRDMDRLYREVLSRFADDPAVEIHRASSVEAADGFPDDSLDWIYLDADHRYESVQADLEAWIPKVKAGGLVCGDDYKTSGWWGQGVTRAVCEAIWRERLRPVLVHNAQYALQKPAP